VADAAVADAVVADAASVGSGTKGERQTEDQATVRHAQSGGDCAARPKRWGLCGTPKAISNGRGKCGK